MDPTVPSYGTLLSIFSTRATKRNLSILFQWRTLHTTVLSLSLPQRKQMWFWKQEERLRTNTEKRASLFRTALFEIDTLFCNPTVRSTTKFDIFFTQGPSSNVSLYACLNVVFQDSMLVVYSTLIPFRSRPYETYSISSSVLI